MPKGPKGFTEEEKATLRTKLCLECERSWAQHGYKKTSIGELTTKVGLSTGAFYLLYSAKEDLFYDTLQRMQDKLKKGIENIIKSESGKIGFINVMKLHFQKYDKAPVLYDLETPDFLAFLNKLPKECVEKLKLDSASIFHDVIKGTNLTLKVNEEKAYALISTLLYTVTIKGKINYDHHEIFEVLLINVVDSLFE